LIEPLLEPDCDTKRLDLDIDGTVRMIAFDGDAKA